jgi:hypothetical protein
MSPWSGSAFMPFFFRFFATMSTSLFMLQKMIASLGFSFRIRWTRSENFMPVDQAAVLLEHVLADLGLGLHLLGAPREAVPYVRQVVRHGGAEHERLPLARYLALYAPYVVDEPHVDHLVRLVEYESLYLARAHRPALKVVHDPARRADDYLGAPEPSICGAIDAPP